MSRVEQLTSRLSTKLFAVARVIGRRAMAVLSKNGKEVKFDRQGRHQMGRKLASYYQIGLITYKVKAECIESPHWCFNRLICTIKSLGATSAEKRAGRRYPFLT